MVQFAPKALTKPRWAYQFVTAGIPDLTTPNINPLGADQPDVLRGLRRVDADPAADLGRPRLAARAVGRPVHAQGGHASTTPGGPSTPASPRSRSPTTAATTSTARPPRSGRCPPVAEAVGDQIEVLLDGGIRRGSDVVKALALGARAP